MLDRKKAPRITTDFKLNIENVDTTRLSNGLSIYEINTSTQEIIKVELVFKAGRVNEEKIAAARACLQVIGEGTQTKSSHEVAEVFDFYGAIVKYKCALESSSISLVCLNRHFDDVWPLFCDILFNPAFDAKETQKYIDVSSQNLRNQISKNDVISYRILTEKIFGSDHPYGYNTQPEDISALMSADLRQFYEKNILLTNAFVILSGKYSSEIKDKIAVALDIKTDASVPIKQTFFNNKAPLETFIQKTKNESQVSIKMGRQMFSRKHEDYSKMFFLNTLFGGYFGSRLMKNIREEKGYTYGIYSSLDAYKEDGFFYIGSDVGNDQLDPCINEINNEMEALKTKLVGPTEFEMVRNYILGQSLHLIDGPFATGQLIKNIYAKDLDVKAFQDHIQTIKNITPPDILALANKYFDKNVFTTVLAGSFNNKI